MEGTILGAGAGFLSPLGYGLSEIRGLPHAALLRAGAPEVARLWARLRAGLTERERLCHIARDGREVWLTATYAPERDSAGRLVRVLGHARSQFTLNPSPTTSISDLRVEFLPNGTILGATPAFLQLLGYTQRSIAGRPHRIFLPPGEARDPAYQAFWDALEEGQFKTAMVRRLTQGGREIWLQARYTPVVDRNGRTCRVVKQAHDVTGLIRAGRHRSQGRAVRNAELHPA